MKTNVGSCDAAVRYVGGIVLLVLANHGWRWGWVGVLPLVTAVAGICPLFWLLGIKSR